MRSAEWHDAEMTIGSVGAEWRMLGWPRPRGSLALLIAGLGLAAASVGCSDGPSSVVTTPRDAGPDEECSGVADGVIACEGTTALTCTNGYVSHREDCSATGLCVARLGCSTCYPGAITCDGETTLSCSLDGATLTRGETCDVASGLHCSRGGCQDLCAVAAEERSYLGCDYVAVPTVNSQLDAVFEFAVIIANGELVTAEVDIAGNGFSQHVSIAPGALETVVLPWVDALRVPLDDTDGTYESRLVANGTYSIQSNVPVAVHQFNPLTFRESVECVGYDAIEGDGLCYSYTNDASLLVPTTALTASYLVVSRASSLTTQEDRSFATPGFVSITNPGAEATTVSITTTANLLGSVDGTIPPHSAGETFSVEIGAGEVLQLLSAVPATCPADATLTTESISGVSLSYCDLSNGYDLTGTEIRSNGTLAVFAGHDCTFAPYDKWACDHLEEQLVPVESLGTSVVAPWAYSVRRDPNLLRIVSAVDDNAITIVPEPSEGPATAVLDRGESLEVTIRAATRVTGSGALLAARYLVGQDYRGIGTSGSGAAGDPSMSLLVPDAQWRTTYSFLAPSTYQETWIDLVASPGARVELDGNVVGDFAASADGVGSEVAQLRVAAGVHRITSNVPVGLQIYGYASYTSYAIPGGLDLREIAAPF